MVAPEQRAELLQAHIDATWKDIEYRWDIEPRSFFEKEAPTNGFQWPLAMAMHYIWKRNPKVAELVAQNATLEARAINAEQKAEYWQRAFGRLVSAHRRELQAVLRERPSRELPDALTSEDFEPDMPVCTEVEL